MEKNAMSKIYTALKQLFIYQPPDTPSIFVLPESSKPPESSDKVPPSLQRSLQELELLLQHAYKASSLLEQLVDQLKSKSLSQVRPELQRIYKIIEQLLSTQNAIINAYESNQPDISGKSIDPSLAVNYDILKSTYQLPDNKDLVIRQFEIPSAQPAKAMLVYMDGLADKKLITLSILQPLMLLKDDASSTLSNLIDNVMNKYLPNGQTTKAVDYGSVQSGINSGDSILFIDNLKEAIIIETKGWEHRTVDRPQFERSIRGSQEAFSDVLRANTALIRTRLKTSNLVTEMIVIGERSRVNCAIMYLESVTNPLLVTEIKRRLNNIRTDFVSSADMLQGFLEDHPSSIFPQSLSTERPDRAAAFIAEGHIAVMLDGSPFVYIMPVTFISLLHSADDSSLRMVTSSFMRLIRFLGLLTALILPAAYLAVSTFHQDALPTDLLLTIAAAREPVPFPSIVEILLMEAAFELITEGGLRVPGYIGPTIGIVGAIILGQAAVQAKIVSPIMVIIVAGTGLASFTISEHRLATSVRLLRYVFLLAAAVMGLLGVSTVLLLLIAYMSTIKSLGIPYLAPFAPKTAGSTDTVLKSPPFAQEKRPDYLNTQDVNRQPNISRVWRKDKLKDGENQ